MSGRRELLIGCGRRRSKLLYLSEFGEEWSELITLDLMATHKPDVVHDLEQLPLPFQDNAFDEIHAYEVLEHTGKQGDWRFFFAQFAEFWRILRPGGVLVGTSPGGGPWVWGDPGHTRVISPECFVFLDQTQYQRQVGVTPMTDYRSVYQADFEPLVTDVRDTVFGFILRAHKPARIAA